MGDCDPEREVVPSCVAECHAAQFDTDVLCFHESSSPNSTGATLCTRGFIET